MTGVHRLLSALQLRTRIRDENQGALLQRSLTSASLWLYTRQKTVGLRLCLSLHLIHVHIHIYIRIHDGLILAEGPSS